MMYSSYTIIVPIRISWPNFDIYLYNLQFCLDALSKLEQIVDVKQEIIIVDYGSIPEYSSKIKELVDKYNFICIKKKADCWSRSRSINIGIRNATGERIFFIDADTILPPNYIQEHLNKATSTNYITNLVLDSSEKENKTSDWQDMISKGGNIRKGGYSHFSVDKLWLDIHNGYNEEYIGWGGEDDDILLRMDITGMERVVFDHVTPVHLWHPYYKDILKEIGHEDFYKINLKKNRERYWKFNKRVRGK